MQTITTKDIGSVKKIGKFRVLHLPSRHEFIVHIIDLSDSLKYGLYHLKMNIHSPFLDKCVRILEDTEKAYCFMDDLEMIDLKSHLLRGHSIGEDAALFYAAQILLSLKDLHKQGVAHMGVHSANIKIVKNGYLRLCGLVTQDPHSEHSSPELLAGEPITHMGDFWALGILIYMLLSGHVHPYFVDGMNPTQLEIEKVIASAVKLKFPSHFRTNAKSIITQLLSCDPSKRHGTKGVQEVMSHSWFSKTDWKSIAEQKETPPWMSGAKISRDFDTEELFLSNPIPILSILPLAFLDEDISGTDVGDEMTQGSAPVSRRGSRRETDYNIDNTLDVPQTFDSLLSPVSRSRSISLDEDPTLAIIKEIMSPGRLRPTVGLNDEPKRIQILKELYTTEKAYVASLNVLIQDFYSPLKDIVTKDVHSKIFMSLGPIVAVNGYFLENLRVSIQNFKNYDDIADVLIKSTFSFKLYVQYIVNYQIAVQTVIDEKKKNSKFESFLSKKYSELNRRGVAIYDILSYLILPIQRLPRYRILFEDLLKCTPDDENEVMVKVVEQMKQVVAYCNDKQRELDEQNRVFALQQKYKIKPTPDVIIIEKSQSESVKVILNQKGQPFEPDSLVIFQCLIVVEKGKEITQFRLGKDNLLFSVESPNGISSSFMLSRGKESITFHFAKSDVCTKWNY